MTATHKGAPPAAAHARAVGPQQRTNEPANPVALYTLGVVYAPKKYWDRAFEWLGKAKATHTLDMLITSAWSGIKGSTRDGCS
jgi:hypothetical protein